jgi:hypothetical protein
MMETCQEGSCSICNVCNNDLDNKVFSSSLRGLDDLWWGHVKLGAKDAVPESACNTKAILVVSKVMSEVILLQLLIVCGKPGWISDNS